MFFFFRVLENAAKKRKLEFSMEVCAVYVVFMLIVIPQICCRPLTLDPSYLIQQSSLWKQIPR